MLTRGISQPLCVQKRTEVTPLTLSATTTHLLDIMDAACPDDISALTNDVAELQLSEGARMIEECNKVSLLSFGVSPRLFMASLTIPPDS